MLQDGRTPVVKQKSGKNCNCKPQPLLLPPSHVNPTSDRRKHRGRQNVQGADAEKHPQLAVILRHISAMVPYPEAEL